MIELSRLDDHLKTLKNTDWAILFDLLGEINPSQQFGELIPSKSLPNGTIGFPYYDSAEIIHKFLQVVHSLKIIPSFNWPEWTEGKRILNNKTQNFEELDTNTLCKLLTVAIRADRFNDGFLTSCFERGVIQKIVAALKDKIRPD
jgi:Family of unknown function (DUF6508)